MAGLGPTVLVVRHLNSAMAVGLGWCAMSMFDKVEIEGIFDYVTATTLTNTAVYDQEIF